MRILLSRRSTSPVRRGLTLIELVVVMVILAAVAGIVLPLLPGMITRAHTSTGATNVGEIGKAIQSHEALYGTYPTNFDSLIVGISLPTYLPGAAAVPAEFAVVELEEEQAEALQHAGILGVRPMVAATTGDWSPTFYPYGIDATLPPAVTLIAEDVNVVTLRPAAAARLGLADPLTTTYVVFGVGGYTSMQGKSLQEAPVHFADSQNETPDKFYSRFGVVFQITNAAGDALEKARLAQVVAFHDGGVVGVNGHLAEYYETASN